MTNIAHCLTVEQAMMIKSVLEGSGLKAFVPDELTAQTNPVMFMGSMNSIRVQVEDEDAETARAILRQNDLPVAE